MNASQALEKRKAKEQSGTVQNTLDQKIRSMENQFQLAMPKGAEASQLVRDAITAMRTTKNLDQCDAASVLGALMNCAQLGLRPAVLGQAWVLPFWDGNKGGHRAQLIIGYQGYIDLAYRSGSVASIIARTVYTNDHFDVDYGLSDNLTHKPCLDGPRGEATAYYAIVKYNQGGHAFWVLSHSEAVTHMELYAPRNRHKKITGPWLSDFDAMARKTAVRQLAKYMPKSVELANAMRADDSVRVDLSPDVEPAAAAEFIDGEVANDATDITNDGVGESDEA